MKRLCAKHGFYDGVFCRRCKQIADIQYNNNLRDRQSDKFYHSKEWKRLRAFYIQKKPVCEECGKNMAFEIHHKIPIKNDWDKRLDEKNLKALCKICHIKIHKKIRYGG